MGAKDYLIIPDIHIPMEHKNALKFFLKLKDDYNIPDQNVYSVGDFLDEFHFGAYPKGADFPITPIQEIEIARKKIKEWGKAFPLLNICMGNHEERLMKRVFEAELPSVIVKSLREIYQFPSLWTLEECFVLPTKSPVLVIHGHGEGIKASNLARNALQFGMSVAFGHFHSMGGVQYLETLTLNKVFGMCVAACVDRESFAFKYGRNAANKVTNGAGVILDNGRTALFHPLLED